MSVYAPSANGKESWKMIQDPRHNRHQNLITCPLGHTIPLERISSQSIQSFLSNPADKQTDRQTNKQTDWPNTLPPSWVKIVKNIRCVFIKSIEHYNKVYQWFAPFYSQLPSHWPVSLKPWLQLRFEYDTTMIRRYHESHDAFDYDGSDRNYDSTAIRLRSDYDVWRAPASIRRDSTRAKN